MTDNKWARLLAYVTGLVNQKLLLQNEYLAAGNRILCAHLPARMRLSDLQRVALLPGVPAEQPPEDGAAGCNRALPASATQTKAPQTGEE